MIVINAFILNSFYHCVLNQVILKIFYKILNLKEIDSSKKIEILFILKSRPNNSILKIENEYTSLDVQIMWCKQPQFNVTKH